MEKQQKWLLRQFHTLCSRLRLSAEEKAAIIEGYGVESSADINNDDLMNICRALEKRLDSNAVKLDRLRKQVIAAICGCRASRRTSPTSKRLRVGPRSPTTSTAFLPNGCAMSTTPFSISRKIPA